MDLGHMDMVGGVFGKVFSLEICGYRAWNCMFAEPFDADLSIEEAIYISIEFYLSYW